VELQLNTGTKQHERKCKLLLLTNISSAPNPLKNQLNISFSSFEKGKMIFLAKSTLKVLVVSFFIS